MILNYFSIFILLLVSLILSIILFSISYLITIKKEDTEKISAYECGFEPYEDARDIFDVRFYLIAIFFIIFDLEAVFLFPWSITLNYIGSFGFWTMIDFLIELLIGYIYVYKIGALDIH